MIPRGFPSFAYFRYTSLYGTAKVALVRKRVFICYPLSSSAAYKKLGLIAESVLYALG